MTLAPLSTLGAALALGLLAGCGVCDVSDQDLILFVRSPRLECEAAAATSVAGLGATIAAATERPYGAARATLLDGDRRAEPQAIVDRYGNVWVRLQSLSAVVLAGGCELEVVLADGDMSWRCRLRMRGFPWRPDDCRMGWIVNPEWRSEAR